MIRNQFRHCICQEFPSVYWPGRGRSVEENCRTPRVKWKFNSSYIEILQLSSSLLHKSLPLLTMIHLSPAYIQEKYIFEKNIRKRKERYQYSSSPPLASFRSDPRARTIETKLLPTSRRKFDESSHVYHYPSRAHHHHHHYRTNEYFHIDSDEITTVSYNDPFKQSRYLYG